MAILAGLKVAIRVNGAELQEYQHPDKSEDTPSLTVKYIEATSKAYFDIFIKITPGQFEVPKNDIGVDIFVDGVCLTRPLLLEHGIELTSGKARIVNGPYKGSGESLKLHRFQFAQLDVNDSDSNATWTDERRIEKLGEIQVVFRHKRCIEEMPDDASTVAFDDVGPLSEKTLKGKDLSHSVKLGEGESVAKPKYYHSECIDDNPLASFLFRYRSVEALKAEGIVSRTSPSAPLEAVSGEFTKHSHGGEKQHGHIKREETEGSSAVDGDDDEVQVLAKQPKERRETPVIIDLTGGTDSSEEG